MACRRLDAVLIDAQLEGALAGFERVRLEKGSPDFERFKVEGIPQLVFLAPDGTETARHRGYRGAEQVAELLKGAKR